MIKIDNPKGTSFSVPQVTSDPSSPSYGDMWVLKTGGGTVVTGGGALYGILGLSTYLITAGVSSGGGAATYQLSYRTSDSSTKRVTIS